MQKVLTDFGIEESFDTAVKRLEEHYGVIVSRSTTRLDVEKHAKKVFELVDEYSVVEKKAGIAVLIGEMDGGMVPIIRQKEISMQVKDKRKNKLCEWKESRLALAHPKGSKSSVYAGTMGSIDEAGDELARAINKAGAGDTSMIIVIGDGAPWIAEQVERLYGSRAVYLLDFFHVSQYLSEASTCCEPDASKQWFHEQQALLKNSDAQTVLSNLQTHIEEKCQLKEKCLALKCYNYLVKRMNQLDYKTAIASGLPIGSGEIESAHRSVVQKRLKISGAWWTVANATNMITMRILRANQQWDRYWSDLKKNESMQVFG